MFSWIRSNRGKNTESIVSFWRLPLREIIVYRFHLDGLDMVGVKKAKERERELEIMSFTRYG